MQRQKILESLKNFCFNKTFITFIQGIIVGIIIVFIGIKANDYYTEQKLQHILTAKLDITQKYMGNNNLDEAEKIYKEIINSANENKMDSIAIKANNGLGKCYFELSEINNTLQYLTSSKIVYERALDLYNKLDTKEKNYQENHQEYIKSMNGLSDVYYELSHIKDGENNLNKSMEYLQEISPHLQDAHLSSIWQYIMQNTSDKSPDSSWEKVFSYNKELEVQSAIKYLTLILEKSIFKNNLYASKGESILIFLTIFYIGDHESTISLETLEKYLKYNIAIMDFSSYKEDKSFFGVKNSMWQGFVSKLENLANEKDYSLDINNDKYAKIHYTIGLAYYIIAQCQTDDKLDSLHKSVQSLNKSLSIYEKGKYSNSPKHALVLYRLGQAYNSISELSTEKKHELLLKSIDYLNKSQKIYENNFPIYNAMAAYEIAKIYTTLYVDSSDKQHKIAALKSWNEALSFFERGYPLYYDKIVLDYKEARTILGEISWHELL